MSLADELNTLRELHDKGKLTDQEYASAKGVALAGLEATTPTARRSAPFWSTAIKVALALILIFVAIRILNVFGGKDGTDLLATAVHAPITLADEVENLPARSVKSLGFEVPYGGLVDVSLDVVRGNPLDVVVIDADQLAAIQTRNWNNVTSYDNFDARKTKTFTRTGRLKEGQYYVVMRDTSLGILSSSASDVSVKIRLHE